MIKYFQKVSFYSNNLNEKWNGKLGEGDNDCVVSLMTACYTSINP